MNIRTTFAETDAALRATVGVDGRADNNTELLSPGHLTAVADELDRAGDAFRALSRRNRHDGAAIRHLARAMLCYSAARTLRLVAE